MTAPVYLAGVIDKPQTRVWYKNIMKTMKENSPLKDVCPDKKLTNNSARKMVLKKLKSSGIPKCEIKTSLATAPSKVETAMTLVKTSKELCPTSSTMPQMQDNYSNLSPQCKLHPIKSTISAIAM